MSAEEEQRFRFFSPSVAALNWSPRTFPTFFHFLKPGLSSHLGVPNLPTVSGPTPGCRRHKRRTPGRHLPPESKLGRCVTHVVPSFGPETRRTSPTYGERFRELGRHTSTPSSRGPRSSRGLASAVRDASLAASEEAFRDIDRDAVGFATRTRAIGATRRPAAPRARRRAVAAAVNVQPRTDVIVARVLHKGARAVTVVVLPMTWLATRAHE